MDELTQSIIYQFTNLNEIRNRHIMAVLPANDWQTNKLQLDIQNWLHNLRNKSIKTRFEHIIENSNIYVNSLIKW